MNRETELWSIKEKRAYTEANAHLTKAGGVFVFTTPSGEILATKVR